MPEHEEKDVLIIGAGLTGLSAGLAYLLNSPVSRVLILEKNPASGGYVTTYARKGYWFDTCQMASNVSDILDYLGIEMYFHEFTDDFIRVYLADPSAPSVRTTELHSGGTSFEERFYALFPEDAGKLRKFFDYSLAMFQEIYGLKYKLDVVEILKILALCPKVMRNKGKTFTEYLKMFGIDNPDISLLFQVFSSMCGLPNDRIAALLTVGVMYSLREKAYRPVTGFIELPRKMEERFRKLDGEVRLKSEVEQIIIENNAVKGVRLKDGKVIDSRNVVSTIDIKSTMEHLVGMDMVRSVRPSYARKIDSIQMTTSTFTVNLGLDDSGLLTKKRIPSGYSLLTSGNDAFSKLYAAFENNRSALSETCFYLGLNCPPVSENRLPTLGIQAIPEPVGDWVSLRTGDRKAYIRKKEEVADLLIGIVDKYLLLGLSEHIVVRDISTPATYARYSGSPGGSIYDMAAVPDNFGANRLPVRTPFRGLLVPKFAHGVFGAMNSGLQAADILLRGKVMQGNSRFRRNKNVEQ